MFEFFNTIGAKRLAMNGYGMHVRRFWRGDLLGTLSVILILCQAKNRASAIGVGLRWVRQRG